MRTARSVCEDGPFGFREFVRLCTRSALNVTREVADLRVPGAASGRLQWVRHHNSVPSEGVHYFGVGGNWRHSWQYDLTTLPTPAGSPAQMVLVYPTGRQRIFDQQPNGLWAAAARFQEKIATTGNGFVVTTPEGATLRFVRSTAANAPHPYEMRAFTDTYGAVTNLDYGTDGWLKRVTEPAGRWLAFDYTVTAHKKGLWRQFGTVDRAPVAGQWIELVVPAAWNKQTFQHLRLRGAKDGAAVEIAEMQFIAAGSAGILRGRANATGDNPAALFDGDTKTSFRGQRASANVCGLDLGADNKSAVARVRVLAKPGKEAALVGAVVEGLEIVASTRPAISKATGSDGRSVAYDYTVLADPTTHHEFLALTGVRYGDATKATYRYEWPRANSRPLLVETDDPRYEGRAKRIRYAYHDQLGVIHQEINPASGAVYASLEFDAKDPQMRTVRYSDLREVKYKIAADRPAILERSDSLGRTKRIEHDDVGRIRATVDHNGTREEYTYGAKNRVASVKRKDRVEKQRDRDADDRIVREVDRQGRETRYERDAKGRVTRMQLGTGEVREFGRDDLGRVTSFRVKRGGLHQLSYNARGLIATRTNPAGGVIRYTYNANDQLVAITDPVGRVARSERNERGLITKITAPDGTTKRFTYDTYGRKISETDAQGRTTKLTYDELSRVIRQEDYAGRVTTLDYTEIPQGCSSCTLAPQPSRIVAPDGTVTAMLYDTEGQLLSRTVAQGTAAQATTLFSYDNDGNMTSMTDPSAASPATPTTTSITGSPRPMRSGG
jgi:YD repeat-containing protein